MPYSRILIFGLLFFIINNYINCKPFNLYEHVLGRVFHLLERGENDAYVFGVDARHVARVTFGNAEGRDPENLYVSIQKIGTFEQTTPFRFAPAYMQPLACFRYNGRDYVWITDKNSIQKSKLFSPPDFQKEFAFPFEHLTFDHLRGDVLVVRAGQFKVYPFIKFLDPLIQNETLPRPTKVLTLPNTTCSDVQFVDGQIFCLEDDFKISQISLLDGKVKTLCPYFVGRFQFILFPRRLSTMAICQSAAASGAQTLELFLYFFDFLVLCALVYLYRDGKLLKKWMGGSSSGGGSSNSSSFIRKHFLQNRFPYEKGQEMGTEMSTTRREDKKSAK